MLFLRKKTSIIQANYKKYPRFYELAFFYTIEFLIVAYIRCNRNISHAHFIPNLNVVIPITFSIIGLYLFRRYRISNFNNSEISEPLFFVSRLVNSVLIFPITIVFISSLFTKSDSIIKFVATLSTALGLFVMSDSMLLFYVSSIKIFKNLDLLHKREVYLICIIVGYPLIILLGIISDATWYIVPVIITCTTFILDEKSIMAYYAFMENKSMNEIKIKDITIRNIYLIKITILILYVLYAISLGLLKIKSLSKFLNFFGDGIFYKGLKIILISICIMILATIVMWLFRIIKTWFITIIKKSKKNFSE